MSAWLFVLLLCLVAIVALAIFGGLIVLVVRTVKQKDEAAVEEEMQYQVG